MPDPLIASAFVRIKPEPKSVSGFGKEVRTSLEKSFTRPQRIKVLPTLLPFKKAIQTELNTTVFTVKVTPVLAPGFKTQVSRLAREAAAGITVPIKPIVPPVGASGVGARRPVGGTVTRGPAASTAASREAAFQKELKKLTDARTASTRALTKAEQTEGTVKERLVAADRALTKSEQILERHLATRVAIEGTLTQKQKARLATQIGLAEGSVATAAALKAELAAILEKTAADTAADAAAKISADLDTQRIALKTKLAAADQAGALSQGKVAAARAVLSAKTSLLAKVEALHTEALLTEDVALQKLTASLLETATAQEIKAKGAVKDAINDEKAAGAAAARTKAEAQLTKGLLATALAAAGARGATLAASFEFLAGAAIAVGIFKSISLASKLEEELNVFRVTAGATEKQIAAVSDKAKQLGADLTLPAVSANDAANAMTELSKAGLSVQDSMDAARGTLQLATAAQLDNETAVNITASALNAFGLAGTEAVHVADLLAGASNAAQGGIGDMGASLSSVASVARQAGLSIEDTVAFLTLLAKNGIQGAEAGTALRVALIRLIAPTKKASDELAELGVNVLDSLGNVRPEVFAEIANATEKLGASQRNAALGVLFGTRAIRAQAVLGRENIAGLNEARDATNQYGLAAELAGARTEGFGGRVEALKNTASSTGLNLGQVLIPALDLLLVGIEQDISAVNKLITALRELGHIDLTPGFGGDTGAFDFLGKGQEAGRFLDRLTAGVPVINAFFDPISGRSEEAQRALDRLNDAMSSLGGNTVKLATDIQGAFGEGGTSGAVEFVRRLEDQITKTTPHGEELRAMLESIERALVALGRAPTDIELRALLTTGSIPDQLVKVQGRISSAPALEIKAGFAKDSLVFLEHAADNAAARSAANSANVFKLSFGSELAASPAAGIFSPFFLPAVDAAKKAGEDAAAAFTSTFDTQVAVLQATGASDSTILAVLNKQLAKRQNILARAQAKFAKDPTKANDAFVKRAAGLVTDTQGDIKTITDKQATESKQAADDIVKARNEADQNFLDALGLRRGRAENRILIAEGTAGLADDVRTHTQLRDLLKRKRDEAAKTIKDAQTKAETIQGLTKDIIAENQTIADLNRQLVDSVGERFEARINIAQITGTVGSIRKLYAAWIDALQKALAEATKGSKLAQDLKQKILETQQAAFSAINEGFELDIQIAEAQERPRAEVRARERFIAQLRKEQAQYRKGSLEWKRLQLEIIQEQKAIEDVKGTLEDRNDALEEMQFTFLQMQSGFVANLLGNLIPSGATAGLVGGGGFGGDIGSFAPTTVPPPAKSLPGQVIPKAASVTEGVKKAAEIKSATGGPTRGGQATELHLLHQILRVLHDIRKGSTHPQAHNRRARDASNMELSEHH